MPPKVAKTKSRSSSASLKGKSKAKSASSSSSSSGLPSSSSTVTAATTTVAIPHEPPKTAPIQVDPAVVAGELGAEIEDECVICMCEINECLGTLVCDHSFCFTCIRNWAKTENTCPLCKVKFDNIKKIYKPKAAQVDENGIPKKKRGRPRKTPPQDVAVKVKNKSQADQYRPSPFAFIHAGGAAHIMHMMMGLGAQSREDQLMDMIIDSMVSRALGRLHEDEIDDEDEESNSYNSDFDDDQLLTPSNIHEVMMRVISRSMSNSSSYRTQRRDVGGTMENPIVLDSGSISSSSSSSSLNSSSSSSLMSSSIERAASTIARGDSVSTSDIEADSSSSSSSSGSSSSNSSNSNSSSNGGGGSSSTTGTRRAKKGRTK